MKWLHLSDIHYNPYMDGRSTSELRKKLIEFLSSKKDKIEEIFITGDFRHAYYQKDENIESASLKAVDYIKQLSNSLNIDIENIHIVPGNHDLTRNENINIENIIENYDYNKGNFSINELESLFSRFDFFKILYKNLYNKEYISNDLTNDIHSYKLVGNVVLIMMNTSLVCGIKGERGRLIIGNNYLYTTLDKIEKEYPDKEIIVLAHHAIEQFSKKEREIVEKLFTEHKVRFYLCGDAHEVWARNINSYTEITIGCIKQENEVEAVFSIGDTEKNEITAFMWDKKFSTWIEYKGFNKHISELFKKKQVPIRISSLDNVVFEKPTRNKLFFGREETLEELNSYLYKEEIVILNGASGIGKSQIAKEYLYRFFKNFNEIYWISGNTKKDLIFQYKRILMKFKVTENIEKLNDELIIYNIKTYFENKENSLLIFDNLNEFDVYEFKKVIPRKNVKILLTTQNSNLDMDENVVMPVKGFTNLEAKEFILTKSTNRQKSLDDDLQVELLISKLNCFPLALEYARAYINKQKITISAYNEIFEEYNIALFDKKVQEYDKSAIKAWELSIKASEELFPKSYEFLLNCSILDNNKIQIDTIFIKNNVYDLIEKNNILESLLSYSLIEFLEGGDIYIHPLTQKFLQFNLESSSSNIKYVYNQVNNVLNSYPNKLKTSNDVEKTQFLMLHSISILNYIRKDSSMFLLNIKITSFLSDNLYNFGNYNETIYYIKEILESSEINNFPNELFSLLSCIMISYHYIGDLENRNKYMVLSNNFLENNLGNIENQYMVFSRYFGNIGIIYKDIKEYRKAINYYRKAIYFAKKTKNKFDIANQMNNIGVLYRNIARYDQVFEYYEKAIECYDEGLNIICEEDELLQIKILSNKAIVLKETKEYEEAINLFIKCKEVYEKLNYKRGCTITYDHLGTSYFLMKNFQDSKFYLEESLKLSMEIGYGIGIANTFMNLGFYYLHTGKLDLAKKNFIDCRDICTKINYKVCIEKVNKELSMLYLV